MNITEWYAISLGGLVTCSLICYTIFFVASNFHKYTRFYFLKSVAYPQIPRYLSGSDRTTRLDILLLVMFLVGNIVMLAVHVDSIPTFISRSGLISVINLMPLFLGGQMNIIASSCGFGLGAYARMHRWLSRIAIVESVIHVITALSMHRPDLSSVEDKASIAAACSLLIILLSGLAKNHWYEMFLNLHIMIGIGAIATIYLHIPTRPLSPPARYLFIGICLQVILGSLRFGQILYRNYTHKRPFSRASIRTITYTRLGMREIAGNHTEGNIPLEDALHVHIRLSKPWKPRAGQYIYLCIPGVSRTAFAQSHPFFVAWSYSIGDDNYAVLIIQKQHGFTQRLFLHKDNEINPTFGMRAIIEGPYGSELNLDLYGTVLLFATGIGIAGQLSYVAQLLSGYEKCQVKTRRIALYWEVESEMHTAWVADKMQELLMHDKSNGNGRILDIHLFVSSQFLSSLTSKGDYRPIGERISMTYNALNVEDVIRFELGKRKGKTVITMCANDVTCDRVRRIIQSLGNADLNGVTLKELDFRPLRSMQKQKIQAAI